MSFKIGDKATVNGGELKLSGEVDSMVYLTAGEVVEIIVEMDEYGDVRVQSEDSPQWVDATCLTPVSEPE